MGTNKNLHGSWVNIRVTHPEKWPIWPVCPWPVDPLPALVRLVVAIYCCFEGWFVWRNIAYIGVDISIIIGGCAIDGDVATSTVSDIWHVRRHFRCTGIPAAGDDESETTSNCARGRKLWQKVWNTMSVKRYAFWILGPSPLHNSGTVQARNFSICTFLEIENSFMTAFIWRHTLVPECFKDDNESQ